MEETKDAESPDRYKLWAAIYAGSAATRRKVYLRRQNIYKLYPNLYVLIISAESGLGKQFPIDLAKNLLNYAGITRVLAGRGSIERIIEKLGRQQTLENGTVLKNAEAALISSEFSNLLIENPAALTILTEWYDTHGGDKWENFLKKGDDHLKNVFISLLGGTNMEHFNNKIAEKDMKGGFVARCIPVYEERVTHFNSLMNDEVPDIDWTKHSKRITEISKLEGVMVMNEEAKVYYDAWYKPFHKNLPADKTGFVKRLRDHILKVASVLVVIEKDELVMEKHHVQDAMDLCLPLLDDLEKISKQAGRSKFRSHNALIVQQLIKAPRHILTHRDVVNRNISEMTIKELQEIIQGLIEGDYIKVVQIENTGEKAYTLSDTAMRQLKALQGDLDDEES